MKKYKDLDKYFEVLWNNPPAPFNPDYIPDHAKMSAEIRAVVAKGEPYSSREARKVAWKRAYAEIRPRYRSLREGEV